MARLNRVLVATTFVALALALGAAGPFPDEVVALFGIPLVGLIVFGGTETVARRARVLHGAAGALALLAWVRVPELRVASVTFLLAVRAWTERDALASTCVVLARAAAMCGVWLAAYQGWPRFHDLHQDVARAASSGAAGLLGGRAALGAGPSGAIASIVAASLVVSLALGASSRRLRVLAAGALAIAVAELVFVSSAPWIGRELVAVLIRSSVPEVFSPLALVIAYAALATWLAPRVELAPRVPAWPRLAPAGLAAAGIAMAFVLAWPRQPAAPPLAGQVLLYDKGYLAWTSPEAGSHGRYSAGMFGMLPAFLAAERLGCERGSTLDDATLARVDAVVFINLLEKLTAEEHLAVWRFVERGGALLVLGDHTGMAGIREPFNALLEPIEVEFGFDCAKPVAVTWRSGMQLFPSSLTRGVEREEQLSIGVGASLQLGARARTVVAASASFADAGDEKRSAEGNIGDFTYTAGEPLGDLPLIAAAEHGAGRVLVFGDTSPFQNGSLGIALPFLDNCLRWLLRAEPEADASATRIGAIASLLALASLLLALAAAPVAACMALALLPFAVRWPWERDYPRPLALDPAWSRVAIDLGHGQSVDGMWWERKSIGGLQLNLLRNRLWILPTWDLSAELSHAPEMALVLPPTQAFTRREIDALVRYVGSGGVLFVTASPERGEHGLALLEAFGIGIGDQPCGPAECDALGHAIVFRSAYPIAGAPDAFRPLATAYERPLAGWMRSGAGALVVVGDDAFLENPNLEGGDTYLPGNVEFLRTVIELLRSEGLL